MEEDSATRRSMINVTPSGLQAHEDERRRGRAAQVSVLLEEHSSLRRAFYRKLANGTRVVCLYLRRDYLRDKPRPNKSRLSTMSCCKQSCHCATRYMI